MIEINYLTVVEAAKYANVSQRTIWRWIRAGTLPARKFGEHSTRIRQDDLERMARRIAAEDPVEEYVRRLLKDWPPLTREQRDRIAVLLHTGNAGRAR